MGDTWKLPGRLTESGGNQLAAFGIHKIDGARTNAVDPPTKPRASQALPVVVRGPSGSLVSVTPQKAKTRAKRKRG
jgi:hypothetical protein